MSQPPSGNGRAQLLDKHALRYLFNTRILRQVLCGPLVATHRLGKGTDTKTTATAYNYAARHRVPVRRLLHP